MITLLLLLLSPFAHADDSWLCQCFENDHSLREPTFVSLDLDLTLKQAEAKSLRICQGQHAAVKRTLARCIVHASKAIATPIANDGPPKPRTFAALTPAQQKLVKDAYQNILAAHEKHDFAAMLAEARQVLALVDDYNDTKSYEQIAQRGLEQTQGK